MNTYSDLISLIAQDPNAMAYFKTLPDRVKSELSQKADEIKTIESLKQYAAAIQKLH